MEHVALPEDAVTAWEGVVAQVNGNDVSRGGYSDDGGRGDGVCGAT